MLKTVDYSQSELQNSSFQIGFNVLEEIISADVDPSLGDNSKGFNNYTPSADRLKITPILIKKKKTKQSPTLFNLLEVQDGILKTVNDDTQYNILGDEMAKRTFEESGHYYVKEFITSVKDISTIKLETEVFIFLDKSQQVDRIPQMILVL